MTLRKEQIHGFWRGVNDAMGLPKNHEFGRDFVYGYIVAPLEGAELMFADYDSMLWWVRAHKYRHITSYGNDKPFKLNPSRHNVCLGILRIAEALLNVPLIREASDDTA